MDFQYLTLSEKSESQGQLWKTDLALQTVSAPGTPDTPDVPGEPSTLPDADTDVIYTIYSAFDESGK